MRNAKLANAQLMLERAGKDGAKAEKKNKEKVKESEGNVGTYSKLQGDVGDGMMTPDHEPQNALMEAVSSYRTTRFKQIPRDVFKGGSPTAKCIQ